MKYALWILLLALVCLGLAPGAIGVASAKDMPYRVVFDLTSRDSLDQKALMRWIQETSSASPEVEIEVVMYGKGWELIMLDRSTRLAEVQEAAKNPRVSFKVCEISMKNNKLEKSMLIPEAGTVPDGIREIVTKQQAGWGYIKVSH